MHALAKDTGLVGPWWQRSTRRLKDQPLSIRFDRLHPHLTSKFFLLRTGLFPTKVTHRNDSKNSVSEQTKLTHVSLFLYHVHAPLQVWIMRSPFTWKSETNLKFSVISSFHFSVRPLTHWSWTTSFIKIIINRKHYKT